MWYRKELLQTAEEKSADFMKFIRENKKAVAVVCIAVCLVSAAELISAADRNQYCRKGKDGALSVVTEGQKNGISLPLTVEAEKEGVRTRMDVILSFGQKPDENRQSPTGSEDPEKELRAQIRDLVRSLEKREEAVIRLPGNLADGTRLRWTDGQDSSLPAILMMLPLGLMLLYRNRKEQEKKAIRAEREEILRQLPGFNSQLLLLLSGGLIFHDAFIRIGEGYRSRRGQSHLGSTVMDILREAEETGSSIPVVMERRSRSLGIREFSRLAGIISDHQYKGVDLTEKLESEREILWTQRKKLAEERGRAAETKLSFPLAMLLLVLILITASPAVLQM